MISFDDGNVDSRALRSARRTMLRTLTAATLFVMT